MTYDAANNGASETESIASNKAESDVASAPRAEVWRREFPVEQAEEFRVTRRGFGAMLCGACVAGAAGLGLVGAAEGESVGGEGKGEGGRVEGVVKPFRAMLSEDLPAGSGHAVIDPSGGPPILILRTKSGELRAYDQRCTHLLCPVHYEPGNESGRESKGESRSESRGDSKRESRGESIHCPCHHGFFDPSTGAPTAGPPRRALPRFAVSVEEGWIVVGGREPAM